MFNQNGQCIKHKISNCQACSEIDFQKNENGLKAIKVMFDKNDSPVNNDYFTSVSKESNNDSIIDYFVGKSFDLSVHGRVENFFKCNDVRWLILVSHNFNLRLQIRDFIIRSSYFKNRKTDYTTRVLFDPIYNSIVSCSLKEDKHYEPLSPDAILNGGGFVLGCRLLGTPVKNCGNSDILEYAIKPNHGSL